MHVYNTKNFLSYPMWDITITLLPLCGHNVLIVSYMIVGPNKPLYQDQGSILIPFVTTHTQPCKYYPI